VFPLLPRIRRSAAASRPSHPRASIRHGIVAVGLLALVTLPASGHAASRVVFRLADPAAEVVIDQSPVRPMGAPNTRTAHHVTAGTHTVIILKGGQELSRSTLEIPDGASVMVQVDGGGGLQVSGASASSATPPPASGGVTHAAPPPAEPPPSGEGGGTPPAAGASALGAAQQGDSLAGPEANSLDMNEGNGRSGGSIDPGPAGNYSQWSQTVGTAGRVVGGVVAPGVGGAVVGTAVPAAAYGAASMVRNAESGGLSALSGGSTFQQGRPIPKKADTGMVAFQCPTGDPIVVYLEGFVIAQVGPGSQKSRAKLEVGRHKLEFMDAETGQYIYRGVVDIEKDETVTLELADTHPPKPLDRTWAWSAR